MPDTYTKGELLNAIQDYKAYREVGFEQPYKARHIRETIDWLYEQLDVLHAIQFPPHESWTVEHPMLTMGKQGHTPFLAEGRDTCPRWIDYAALKAVDKESDHD